MDTTHQVPQQSPPVVPRQPPKKEGRSKSKAENNYGQVVPSQLEMN